MLVQGDCGGWQCYGSVFWLNNPDLDGDVVYARDLPDRRAELFRAYPDRFVYYAYYGKPAYLSIYGSSSPVAPSTVRTAPKARDIPLPSPTPTATPDVTQSARRDDQRRHDLDILAQALQRYYVRHGTYPIASGIQSFCTYASLDAACSVSEVLDPLPHDPTNGQTYYYLSSDGHSFYVFAQMERPAGPSQCTGAPLKPGIPPDHLYCVHGTPETGAATPALAP